MSRLFPQHTRRGMYRGFRKGLLPALALVLNSCTGAQYATFHPNGTPKMVALLDATLAKGESSAREITLPNGTAFRSVQQNYDGTTVATSYLDGRLTLGLGRAFLKNEAITKKAEGEALIKGTKDPNVIPVDPNVIPVNPNLPAE